MHNNKASERAGGLAKSDSGLHGRTTVNPPQTSCDQHNTQLATRLAILALARLLLASLSLPPFCSHSLSCPCPHTTTTLLHGSLTQAQCTSRPQHRCQVEQSLDTARSRLSLSHPPPLYSFFFFFLSFFFPRLFLLQTLQFCVQESLCSPLCPCPSLLFPFSVFSPPHPLNHKFVCTHARTLWMHAQTNRKAEEKGTPPSVPRKPIVDR